MDLFGESPATTPMPKEDAQPQEPALMQAAAVDLMASTASPMLNEETEALGHPRYARECLGHDAIEEQLSSLYEAGRMPHGLIFAGIKGIGKATLAYLLAKKLLGDDARVASGGHADFLSVERHYDAAKNTTAASVTVDQIRKVTPFLRMTAADGGWRVVIIDDADTMNRNAQNAILKILEEPPKNTVIILVAHRLGALIPTIRSRTRTLNFTPLSDQHIAQLLARGGHALPAADQANLIAMAEGSIGTAVSLLEEGGLEALKEIEVLLQSYPRWDWGEIHRLADRFARKGQEQGYENFARLMCWIFAQLCKAKGRGAVASSEIFQTRALQDILQNSSLASLLDICEKLEAHFAKVQRANLDKKQAVIGVFSLITA